MNQQQRMKFWKTKEFQKTCSDWYMSLKELGFIDIENNQGNLKQMTTRKIPFEKAEITREFFCRLDRYLYEHTNIPLIERQILELYTQGHKIICRNGNGIINKVPRSDKTIRNVIKKYKTLILKG